MKFKEDFDLDFFLETSAKTGFNTEELFVEASKILYDDYMKYQNKQKKGGDKVKLDKNKAKKEEKKRCCK